MSALVTLSVCLTGAAVANGKSEGDVVAATPALSGYVLATTLGDHGMLTFPSWTGVRDIVVLIDGSALVQLDRDGPYGVIDAGVAKLRPNGTLDTAFASTAATPGISDLGTPGGSLTVRSDGRFFVGTRLYRGDGSVESSYGTDGYVGSDDRGRFGNNPTALVEASADRLTIVSGGAFNDCYIFPIDASGRVGSLVSTRVLCDEAIPLLLPDGSTLVVLHEISDGYHLIRLAADGTLDKSFGTAGVVTVTIDPNIEQTRRLIDAALTSDGDIVLLAQSLGDSTDVVKIRSDGSLDSSFGSNGAVKLNGMAQDLTVDATSAPLVGVGYTFALHPSMPYHPALLQFTPSGQINRQFNPSGIVPGWLDMTELGIDEPALGGPHAQFGSEHLLVGMGFGATGTSPRLAVLIELESVASQPSGNPPPPTTPPVTFPPPATFPPTPHAPQVITAPAGVAAKAVRLGVIAGS